MPEAQHGEVCALMVVKKDRRICRVWVQSLQLGRKIVAHCQKEDLCSHTFAWVIELTLCSLPRKSITASCVAWGSTYLSGWLAGLSEIASGT